MRMTKGNFLVKWVTVYFVIMGCCLWNTFKKHARVWCGCRCGSEWESSLFDRNLVLFLIEIPLFHVLNARITFENVNGCRTADKTSSQMVGGAQCDSGKEWKDAVFASFYISVSGMHRRERWVNCREWNIHRWEEAAMHYSWSGVCDANRTDPFCPFHACQTD